VCVGCDCASDNSEIYFLTVVVGMSNDIKFSIDIRKVHIDIELFYLFTGFGISRYVNKFSLNQECANFPKF
jgi:hypothetical protein